MIAMDFGCFFIAKASLDVITLSPSTATLSKDLGLQPVAIMTLPPVTILPASFPSVISTSSAVRTIPLPTM